MLSMKATHLITSLLALALFAGCAAIDRQAQNTLVQHNVSPVVYNRMLQGDALSVDDIIELSRRQVPADMIIRYLRSTCAVYMLDKQSLSRLKQAKVCQEVIDYLLETPRLFAPRFYPRPYYDCRPWYPYEAYYPYYPYYPQVYGTSVIVVGGRGHFGHRW